VELFIFVSMEIHIQAQHSQLALYIVVIIIKVIDALLIFSHMFYFGNIWEPCGTCLRYNGIHVIKDRVLIEFRLYRKQFVLNRTTL